MRGGISASLLALAALASPVMWGETLAEAVRADALRLKPEIETARGDALRRAAIRPVPLKDELTGDLRQFGFNAARLAAEIDARGGETDLRCIFRGMAEETDAQLRALATVSTGAQQAVALSRLFSMLRDAAEVAPAVGSTNLRPKSANAAGTIVQAAPGRCPAESRS